MCDKFAEPISASLHQGNTAAPFREMSRRWQAVSVTVSDFIFRRFEPQAYCFRDERVAVEKKIKINKLRHELQPHVCHAKLIHKNTVAAKLKQNYEPANKTKAIISFIEKQ